MYVCRCTHTQTHTHTGTIQHTQHTHTYRATGNLLLSRRGLAVTRARARANLGNAQWRASDTCSCMFVCVCAFMFWICTCNIHTKWIYGKDKGKSKFGQRLKTDYWWPACIACTTGHWVASSDWRLVTGHLESPHCCPAGGSPALNLIACELCSAPKHLRRYRTVKPTVHT